MVERSESYLKGRVEIIPIPSFSSIHGKARQQKGHLDPTLQICVHILHVFRYLRMFFRCTKSQ
jgi:hypothetical protein